MVQVYIACHWWVDGLLLQLPVRVEMPQNLLSRLKGTKPKPKNYEYIACYWWVAGCGDCYNCLSREEMPQGSAVKAPDSRETNPQVTLNRTKLDLKTTKKYEYIACPNMRKQYGINKQEIILTRVCVLKSHSA